MAICSYDGCLTKARSRGLCGTHYERMRRHGTTEVKQRYANLAGQQFGNLTVVDIAEAGPGGVQWRCLCVCGAKTAVATNNLKSGHTISCGCARGENSRTHGMSKTPTYKSWVAMRRRCADENYIEWHLYGGRGIQVSPAWMMSFEQFFVDVGLRPRGCTLDRIDPNGHYEPGNVRWATGKEQARNTRKSKPGSKAFVQLCEEAGLSVNTVRSRISRQGMSVEEALSTPLRYSRRPS